jgi:hypothetical protein
LRRPKAFREQQENGLDEFKALFCVVHVSDEREDDKIDRSINRALKKHPEWKQKLRTYLKKHNIYFEEYLDDSNFQVCPHCGTLFYKSRVDEEK